jgi:hypothetical protein
MPGGFGEAKVIAGFNYADFFLKELPASTPFLHNEAMFWDIDVTQKRDWFALKKLQNFSELKKTEKHRIIGNACATFYATRLVDYDKEYKAAGTLEKNKLRDNRITASATPLESLQTREEKRVWLADFAHDEPTTSVKILIGQIKKKAEQEGRSWAINFAAPSVTAAQNKAYKDGLKVKRDKGVLNVDMEDLHQWALAEETEKYFTKGSLGVAVLFHGGRRAVETINPLYEMTAVDGCDNSVHMNFQAKQRKGPPTPRLDTDEESLDDTDVSVTFHVSCSAAAYLTARAKLQQQFKFGVSDAEDVKCVASFIKDVNKFIKSDKVAAVSQIRDAAIEKHKKFTAHHLRKLYAAFIIWQLQESGDLPPGDEHRLEYVQHVLNHSDINNSKAYNMYSHVPGGDVSDAGGGSATVAVKKRKAVAREEVVMKTESDFLYHLHSEVSDFKNPLDEVKRRKLIKTLSDML